MSTRKLFPSLCLAALFVTAVGCGHERRPTATPAPVSTPTSVTFVESAQVPRKVAVSPGINVTEEIREVCKLPLGNVAAAPKFAFDESDLELADYDMLQRIGECLTTGPLAGRSLSLTGRADMIGTEEYNLALGAHRADTVANYLERFGVDESHLRQTSRGELDARGMDPATRQVDRRVDLALVK